MRADQPERTGKIRAWILPALLLLALLATLLMPWLLKQLAIDGCLDSGGAFDYKSGTCLHDTEGR